MISYLVHFVLVILIVDETTFFKDVPLLAYLQRKFPTLTHPFRCSLCASFWTSILFVLFCHVPLWCLVLPFFASVVSKSYELIYDALMWCISKLSRLFY